VTESPEAVRQAVKAILASPTLDVPAPVAEVDAYRAAALRICEADLPPRAKWLFVLALVEDLRGAQLPEWCHAGVWEEVSRPLFGVRAPSRRVAPRPGHSSEGRARALRRAGYDSCPSCLQPVIPELLLDQGRHERDLDEEEGRLRSEARASLDARIQARLAAEAPALQRGA
jgi:hypothetical protein